MVFPRAAWSTNEMTKEIAAPIKLNGSHFLIARQYLSKLYTYHDSKMRVNLRCEVAGSSDRNSGVVVSILGDLIKYVLYCQILYNGYRKLLPFMEGQKFQVYRGIGVEA